MPAEIFRRHFAWWGKPGGIPPWRDIPTPPFIAVVATRQNEACFRIPTDRALEAGGWNLLDPQRARFERHASGGWRLASRTAVSAGCRACWRPSGKTAIPGAPRYRRAAARAVLESGARRGTGRVPRRGPAVPGRPGTGSAREPATAEALRMAALAPADPSAFDPLARLPNALDGGDGQRAGRDGETAMPLGDGDGGPGEDAPRRQRGQPLEPPAAGRVHGGSLRVGSDGQGCRPADSGWLSGRRKNVTR